LEKKVNFIGKWVGWNAFLAFSLTMIIAEARIQKYFILFLGYFYTAFLGLRSISAVIYLGKYYLYDKQVYKRNIAKNKK
jgi:hypothetical protein